MINSKGFSLIESLVASTLLMMMITILIPITNTLMHEREVLHQKRIFLNELHDELQPYLWNNSGTIPSRYSKEVNNTTLNFHFFAENELLKGCVRWDNVKNQSEQICLNGYTSK